MWHEMSHVYVLSHDERPRAALVYRRSRGARRNRRRARLGRPPQPRKSLPPSATKSFCRSRKSIAVSCIPPIPSQVIVSYYQAGKICDYISERWGESKLLDMIHEFAKNRPTVDVIREQLRMEPEAFDKDFLADDRQGDRQDGRRISPTGPNRCAKSISL